MYSALFNGKLLTSKLIINSFLLEKKTSFKMASEDFEMITVVQGKSKTKKKIVKNWFK